MKKIAWFGWISFLLLISICLGECKKDKDAEEENEPKMPFTDNFSNYSSFPSGYWEYEDTTTYGSWSIVSDGAQGNVAAYDGAYGIVILGLSTWTNYTYTAKFKPSDAKTDYQNYGIIGRYQDVDNFYMLHIYKDASNSYLSIDRKYLGNFVIQSQDIFAFDSTQYYTFTFEFNGSNITGSVDGGPTLSISDSSIPQGKIGFFAQKPTYFDDVSVTAL
jgi:hypothetical protein